MPREKKLEQETSSMQSPVQNRYAIQGSSIHLIFQPESDRTLSTDTFSNLKYCAKTLEDVSLENIAVSEHFEHEDKEDLCTDADSWNELESFQSEKKCESYKKDSENSKPNVNSISLDAISLNERRNAPEKAQTPCNTQTTSSCDVTNKRVGCEPLVRSQPPELTAQSPTASGQPYSSKFCDAIIVYAQNDIYYVLDFMQAVKNLTYSECHFEPRLELYDQVTSNSTNVSSAEEVLDRSAVVFIYLTENTNSRQLQLFIDEAVGLSRLGVNLSHVMVGRWPTDRQWILKPVHTLHSSVRTYKTPAGLVSCRGVDWFDRCSPHTGSTIVNIMREAHRIREEMERRETGLNFQSQFRTSEEFHRVSDEGHLNARGSFVSHKPVKTCGHQFTPSITPTGDIKVTFRPSAAIRRPPPFYKFFGRYPPPVNRSFAPPVNQPRSYQIDQPIHSQQNAVVVRRNYAEARTQNLPHAQVVSRNILSPVLKHRSRYSNIPIKMEAPIHRPHVHFVKEDRHRAFDSEADKRQLKDSVQTDQLSTRRNTESHNGSDEQRNSRSHRSGLKFSNNLDSSGSEASSSDESEDSDDMLPRKYKHNRNINILGCKYVQLGKNNKVMDKTAISKKTDKATRKNKHADEDNKDSSGLESEPTSKNTALVNEKKDISDNAVNHSEPLILPLISHSSKTLNSAVVQDNLDVSNINLTGVGDKEVASKDKSIPDLLSLSSVKEQDKPLNVSANNLMNLLLDTDATVKLKGKMKEYQVNVKDCDKPLNVKANNLMNVLPETDATVKLKGRMEEYQVNVKDCDKPLTVKANNLMNVLPETDATVKLKGRMEEYQVTLNKKQKDVFVNDLDKLVDEDDSSTRECASDPNIYLDNSGDENNINSEDQESSENEHQEISCNTHKTDCERNTMEKPSRSPQNNTVLQSSFVRRSKCIGFLQAVNTLQIITPTNSSAPDRDLNAAQNREYDDVE